MTTKYTIQELDAVNVIRKSMVSKPEIIKLIMRDTAYLASFNILKQAQQDLRHLLTVTQTFSEAAKAIMEQNKEYFNDAT